MVLAELLLPAQLLVQLVRLGVTGSRWLVIGQMLFLLANGIRHSPRIHQLQPVR
jgi:hypothetical protein